MEREFLTDEEVIALLRAFSRGRFGEEPSLEAAPPESRGVQEWTIPEQDLWVRQEPFDGGTKVVLSGGKLWQDALAHLRWEWFDATRPERKNREWVTAFVLMPANPDPWGKYSAEITLRERVVGCPAPARIVPRYVAPEEVLKAWRAASVKPPLQELEEWINRHGCDERWERILEELRKGLRASQE